MNEQVPSFGSKKNIIIAAGVVVLVVLLVWLFVESSKPLPGQSELQNSRNHIPEGSKIDYKFNPPTSGDHYPSWITKGFYDTPRFDGNLVHSEEHGYIIFWYDCTKKVTGYMFQGIVGTVYAQEQASASAQMQMTSGSQGSPSATLAELPKVFSDGSCDNFKNKLKDVYQKSGPHKLIFVPRVGMNNPLILTAWGRILKLDSLDQQKIKEFIDVFRDAGPEATVEP